MSKSKLQTVGLYLFPWLLSIVIDCSTATVLNRFYRFDDDGGADNKGVLRWFIAKPSFTISKKHMNERVVNSLLRNAWIG
uniref:Secreted protein n=1 Tax=Setaria digitata TaxID=48799 RepID=A0A915PWQ4_9BILA